MRQATQTERNVMTQTKSLARATSYIDWTVITTGVAVLRRLRDKGALEGVIKIKIKKSSEHCSCVSGGPPGNTPRDWCPETNEIRGARIRQLLEAQKTSPKKFKIQKNPCVNAQIVIRWELSNQQKRTRGAVTLTEETAQQRRRRGGDKPPRAT